MALAIHPLAEHPPLEPTNLVFVHEGEEKPTGWPWQSGLGGAVFFRQGGPRHGSSWGEVIDQIFEWANDPDFDDTLPIGWVRLVPEEAPA